MREGGHFKLRGGGRSEAYASFAVEWFHLRIYKDKWRRVGEETTYATKSLTLGLTGPELTLL